MDRPVSPSSAQGTTGMPPQAQAELVETARRPLVEDDALAYLDEIRAQFHDHPAAYSMFLDLLNDVKADRIEIPTAIERVNALFANYPRLIDGFHAFLPTEYHLEGKTWYPLPVKSREAAPADGDRFNEALDFVNRIRRRFADSPDVYKKFLEALQVYQLGGMGDPSTVVMQVTLLFHGHDDLIEGFKKFINTNN